MNFVMFDKCTEGGDTAYRTRYEPDSGTRFSTAIVIAVAEARGTDPLTFHEDAVLADKIDPDALDELFHQGNDDWRLDFALAGSEVTVQGDGTIVVRPT